MHPKAIIHTDHHHLLGLHAEFPIGVGDPDGEELGELEVGDKKITMIQVIRQREFISAEESAQDLYVVACAVLDYNKGLVYTFTQCQGHQRLVMAFDLERNTEQDLVRKDLIFGFVTASGHFFNRASMYYLLKKYHPQFLKKDASGGWFNSEMINWKATANSFAPVIHEDHGNVMGLVAEFPIASEDPDSKEPGSLDLVDKELRTIKFVSESTLMRDLIKDPEVAKDLYAVSCACLDYKNQKVYTFNLAQEHARLCQVFGLDSTQEQIWVNRGLIFGFVTASGHFFNRETMYFVLSMCHPQVLKPDACGAWFNSEMINWKEVMNKLHARTCS